jgi:hypothetical protein
MRIGYLILGIFFAIIVIFLVWFYISHEILHQQHAFGVSDNGNSNDKAIIDQMIIQHVVALHVQLIMIIHETSRLSTTPFQDLFHINPVN